MKPAKMGTLPLIVLTQGRSDITSGADGVQQGQLEQEWSMMQVELAGLSSNSKQVIAEKSGHYIQFDQPELVIESIIELVSGY